MRLEAELRVGAYLEGGECLKLRRAQRGLDGVSIALA